jgi:hypothetical protein
MIRWKPSMPAPRAERWRSRDEIVKEHLDRLTPGELLAVRPDYYALHRRPGALRCYDVRKFDSNQPRVPAGNPDGGQWTTAPSGLESAADDGSPTDISAVRRRPASWCWNQMRIDMLYCATLYPPWRVAACRAQANERYAACLAGKPVPPLPF